MIDHNGNHTSAIRLTFIGDRELLNKLRLGLIQKGFTDDKEWNDMVVRKKWEIHKLKVCTDTDCEYNLLLHCSELNMCDPIQVTPENIDTFINNMQS